MPGKTRKTFLTYEQQLAELINHKKLSINDIEAAKKMLKDVGYFALIGGYKEFLRDKVTQKYFPGVDFDDIIALYEFDAELREMFFHYICKIEKNIRSILSYEFCVFYGEQQSEYLDKSNYNYAIANSTKKSRAQIDILVNKLEILANTSMKYPYIVHQRKKYGNVPLWVLVNAMEFGSLSKMYELLKPQVQIAISKNYVAVSNADLRKFLKFLVSFRNICAHHERFFAYKSYCAIPNTMLHKKFKIVHSHGIYASGQNDVFAILISFKYLLSRNDFVKMKRALNSIIKKYLKRSNVIPEGILYEYMGFPLDWKNISRYRRLN